MSLAEGLRRKLRRMRYGFYTPKEILLLMIDSVGEKLLGRKPHQLYIRSRVKRLLRPEGNMYHIKDIRFPILDTDAESILAVGTIDDTFSSYIFFDDRYDEKIVDLCDSMTPEGLYGLVNDKVNVTVNPGDIVIDAGSWIGDFAAYASVKGATTYAFEPTDTIFAILQKTAELNGNIIPVKKGLSDENTSATIFVREGISTSNSLMDKKDDDGFTASSTVETVRLDDFVRENNIPRVDFIKCDIEGFERRMLAGAQETLARFAPKLALCTYHLPDDPQVMAGLIKQANPKYNIVQKRKKLFASVPQE